MPAAVEKPFVSLIPHEQITSLSGTVSSNPVKNSSGTTWTVIVETDSVQSSSVSSSSKGSAAVIIPAGAAEAHFPGKMFSGSGVVLETGALVHMNVHLLDNSIPQRPLFYAHSAEQHGWKNSIAKIRAFSRMCFRRIMYVWGEAGGLFLALMSGSREYTDKHLAESFKNAGLAHILALSGMHLSFFAGIASKAGKLTAGARVSPVLSFAAVVLFVWFAGFSPSLYRAFIASVCSMVIACGTVKPEPVQMISLSFIIQSCLHPSDTAAASFLLSYGALLGMSSIGSYIERYVCRIFPPVLSKDISSSIGAQLCTAPVCISMFGCVMPIGIAAGVIISPLVNIFMIVGLICTVLSLCMPFLLVPLGDIMHILYILIEKSVTFFSQIPPITVSL